MSADFAYPVTGWHRTATAAPGACTNSSPPPSALHVDLLAARRAGRSCCCSARPAVIAVMPPAPGRPHQTDLLLCGHHYRACRQALAAAGATVVDIDGIPVTGNTWSLTSAPV